MDFNDALLICLAVSISTGLLFVFLGYQIAEKQKQHWINGVDFEKLSDPTEFTRAVGRSITNTGIFFFILSLVLYLDLIGMLAFALILTLVSFYPVVVFIRAKGKYSSFSNQQTQNK